jgi:hypothetical protein
VRLAQLAGDPDPLVVTGRRHSDVEDHDVRWIGLDRGEEGVAVGVGAQQLDRVERGEDLVERLADQVGVVRQRDADGTVAIGAGAFRAIGGTGSGNERSDRRIGRANGGSGQGGSPRRPAHDSPLRAAG